MKIQRQILRSFFILMSIASTGLCVSGPEALAQSVDADPQGENQNQPPPGERPPPDRPNPDLMPQQPAEASPPNGDYQGPYYRRPRRHWFVDRSYPEEEARLRVYAALYYDFSGTAYSNNGSTTFAGPTPLSVDMSSTPGVAAEVFQARPYGWGFDAGLSYDFTRNVNDLNTSIATVLYTTSKPTLQFTTIYGNGIFRWWNLYIPLGLNYTIPSFSGGTGNGTLTNSTFTGNIGFQFGLGFLLGHNFALELEDRVLHFQATSVGTNNTITWGDTYLSGFHINLKFSFL